MCRINPRVDFAFKKLFGTESNKKLLIDLINSIVSEEDQVKELELKNPYNDKNFRNDKLSILDIKAIDQRGQWYNIEMQVIDQEYFDKRALYYWARLYSGQLSAGVNYDNLKKTISINILNFRCLDEEKYHNIYKIINSESGKEFINHLEIHFIELEKYDEKMSTMLDRWVNFLKKAEGYDKNRLPKELAEVESIKKAVELLDDMSLNYEERESYEARLKWLRDEEAAIKTAEKKGFKKGQKEGIEQGREEGREEEKIKIAKSLLDILDIKTISEKTGLSEEQIRILKK
ncbi:Rpn family recombination-promoting nuclease/putative transposase [Haliovirga abyssi]|uniref:Transposase n=1 Tax=Haliovirga abyssi TaxID=2996794 RepID=A0AAU9DGI5_9FUSO|nr:Rpn family recombination-promoting nuclease/putative transposase [Haliovirga abyssi]BDU50557.1 transposase [Haliovirga abyssi]